jgi:hypothetical protein
MSSSGSSVSRPDDLVGITQPLQPDAVLAAPQTGELAVNPPTAPVPQQGGFMPPPTFANYNNSTAAVQVNNVITAPTVTLSLQQHRTPFIIRAIWFVCVGWWLSGLAIIASFVMFYFVLTIPIGIWLLHRIPQLQTLRDRTREFQTHIVDGNVVIREGTITQRPFWQRALWFVFIGWWLTTLWVSFAWAISLLILPLPISIMMIDRAPAILTLQKF